MPPQTAVTRRFSFETASVWALIATVIAAAVIVIPLASVPFLSTKTFVLAAGGIITLVLYILARLTRGNVIFPPVVLVGALWLPVLAYGLSTLFSGVGLNGVWGTLLEPDTFGFILTAALLGTLAALAIRRVEHYRSFLTALAYALGFTVLVQLLIIVVGQFAPQVVSPTLSIIGSLSDLASLLGLGVVVGLLALRFLTIAPKTRIAALIVGALALALLAIANVPFVWILVALVSLGLFVEAVMQKSPAGADSELDGGTQFLAEESVDSSDGARSLAIPLVVLAISLFFLIGGTLGGALASGLGVNVLDVRPSWSSTLAVGSAVYGTSPLFGSGPGTFGTQWLMHRDASLNSTIFWNVDFTSGIGFIPTSFVTTGILGVLAWLGFFGLFLYFGVRTLLQRMSDDPFIRFVSIASFVGTLYLFAIAIFSVPGGIVLALAFIFAGVFASTIRFASGRSQWGIVFARAPRLGFVIVFGLTLLLLASIVAAYSLSERYVAQIEFARSVAALNAGNLDAAEQSATQAIAFNPSVAAYQLQAQVAGARISNIANSTTAAADSQQAFQAALSAGINAALTATRLEPNNYQNWMILGNLYSAVVPLNVTGAYENAKTAFEKARALNPTSPSISYAIAQLEVAHKDNKAAEEELKTAIGLKQDYTAAIFLLSQLEVSDGNLKDALTSAEAAAYFTPNNPSILFQVGILRAANNDMPGAIQALAAAVLANPQFANARYFLAAAYAKNGDLTSALEQVKAIAALSAENATAVAELEASLTAGKNPFPENLLSAPPANVSSPTDTPAPGAVSQ